MLSVAEGSTIEEARKQFYLVDTKGLITKDRADFKNNTMASHKLAFARDDITNEGHITLMDVIKAVKPTVLLGLSTIPQSFTEEIVKTAESQIK